MVSQNSSLKKEQIWTWWIGLDIQYRACPLLGVLHNVCVDDGYVCYLLAGYANLKLSQAWSIKLSVSQHFREYFRDTCIFNQGELEGWVNWLWLHYIGDLHLVLHELNLFILNACILILVQVGLTATIFTSYPVKKKCFPGVHINSNKIYSSHAGAKRLGVNSEIKVWKTKP